MWRKLKWLLGFVAILSVLLSVTPLADVYSAPLVIPPNPQRSDVIVLMSSGMIDEDWVTPDGAQRTWGALKLYQERFAPVVISVGGNQAAVQAAMLKRAGVPPEAILVDKAVNTYWSALAVSRIMKERAWNSAVIVTSQLDVPRVSLVFRRLGLDPSFLPVPEFRKPPHFHLFRRSAFDISYHATYEYVALISYKWRGWL